MAGPAPARDSRPALAGRTGRPAGADPAGGRARAHRGPRRPRRARAGGARARTARPAAPLPRAVARPADARLYRCGRQADALGAYQRLRVALREELGIDPSPALRQLQSRILGQDASLDLAAPVVVTRTPPARPVPAQLPPVARAFVSRRTELARLDELLAADRTSTGRTSTGRSPAMVISAVAGTAGVGKTTLAVHWASRVGDRFPDGQLYVDLCGFDPGPALEPATAVRGFLDALGVPADRIPADLAAQTGLYRSLLAGRRMLVVLDNARTPRRSARYFPVHPGVWSW